MKEYTILALGSAVGALILDRLFRTFVVRKRAYWIAVAVMMLFMIPFNGYLVLTEKVDKLWIISERFVRILSTSHGRTTSCVANRVSN